jgi:hypothetical protein
VTRLTEVFSLPPFLNLSWAQRQTFAFTKADVNREEASGAEKK